MANLPDLGNPHKLAGTARESSRPTMQWHCMPWESHQWWDDYRQLLEEVGLAKYVRKASSSELGSFGDGPASRPGLDAGPSPKLPSSGPECVVLQVPFWYDGPEGSVLVTSQHGVGQCPNCEKPGGTPGWQAQLGCPGF